MYRRCRLIQTHGREQKTRSQYKSRYRDHIEKLDRPSVDRERFDRSVLKNNSDLVAEVVLIFNSQVVVNNNNGDRIYLINNCDLYATNCVSLEHYPKVAGMDSHVDFLECTKNDVTTSRNSMLLPW